MAESISVGTTRRDTDAGSSRAPLEADHYAGATAAADAHNDTLEETDGEASRAPLQTVALPAEKVRALAARRTAPPRFTPEFDAGPVVLWVLLAVPTLAVLATAIGAILAALGSLWALVQSMLALQFADAANVLPALDTSGRILLAAAGYFALLVALRALTHSLRASGWKRLRALWAMVVMLPATWLFVAGAGLVSGAGPFSAIPADLWRGVVLFLLLQVIALAVVTTQPSARVLVGVKAVRSGYRSHDVRGWSQPAAGLSDEVAPLPVVRFGPPQGSQLPDDEDRPEFRISGLTVLPRESLLVDGAPEPPRPSQ